MEVKPKVAVLMATYNGIEWISVQVDSVLSQQGVDLKLFVSDDCSTDSTRHWIRKLADSDGRVVLLPQIDRMGSAGKNFYRLICDVNLEGFDYISFADQDDVWHLNKLARHVALIKEQSAECISSNVMAFWPDGFEKLICKSQPQKKWDFIFESAGPGCSFLMTPWLVFKIREQLQSASSVARCVVMHDWLAYAICRANNRKWVIDSIPSLRYRQHTNNVIGANSGVNAIFARLHKIRQGWYREEVSKICKVCAGINSDINLNKLAKIIQKRTFLSQMQLLIFAGNARRKLTDRFVLILTILLFIF